MPNSALYTTLADLKLYLGIPTEDETEDSRLNAMILAASRAVDTHCRRRFYPYVETRRYDAQLLRVQSVNRERPAYWWADTMRKMLLDRDLISVTSFHNGDGSTIDALDYLLYPLGGPPYSSIELRLDRGTLLLWQNTPQAAFALNGTWGYVTPDSEAIIPVATRQWAAVMLDQADSPGVQSKSIGSFSVSYSQKLPSQSDGRSQAQLRPSVEIAQMLEGFRKRVIASTFL